MAESLFPSASDVLNGRYAVGQEVGRGGYSVVYTAKDLQVGDTVAVKVIVPPPAEVQVAFSRLRREALALQELHHMHIVQGLDLYIEDHRALLIMQYIEGADLGRRINKTGPLAPSEIVSIGAAMTDAIGVAHHAGIIHRDIKPQNILLDKQGHPWLSDFGSAQVFGQSSLTITGAVVGTLGFMAPEILAGGRADARVDLYSLGVTLYFAATGRMPGGEQSLLVQAKAGGFDPREMRPDLPSGISAAICRATCADPADRFPTAEVFAKALANADYALTSTSAQIPQGIVCLACGEEGVVELGVCRRCLKGAVPSTHTAVFLEPSGANAPPAAVTARIRELLPAGVKRQALRETLQGVRPLLRTAPNLAQEVAKQLARLGIATRITSSSSLRSLLPQDILLLTAVIAGLSIIATTVVGGGFLMPGTAVCCALIYFGRNISTISLVESLPYKTLLNAKLNQRVADLMIEIKNAHTRKLLARLARAVEEILKADAQGAFKYVESAEVEQLMGHACDLAQHISRLDEAAASANRLCTSEEFVSQLIKIERTREAAMHQLLAIAAAVEELYLLRLSTTEEKEPLQLQLLLEDVRQTTRLYREAYNELGLRP